MERDFRYDGLVLFLHQRKDGIRRLVKIGGKYYYFDGDGAMQTGWVDDDTYYTNADGVMQIGWAYLEDPDDTKKDDDEVKPGDAMRIIIGTTFRVRERNMCLL